MKKKIVPIILMSLSSFVAQALGLGEMKVRSFLNQPFNAEIELTDLDDMPLSGIKADVASVEEFERMGMDRANVLNYLNFSVEKNSAGRSVIRVRSIERITEPYLQILVDVVWATGQVYRSYTILLDPPAYKLVTVKKNTATLQSDRKLMAQPGVVTIAEDTEVHNNPQSVDGPGINSDVELTYGPTRANETIWQIAQRYRKEDVLLQQMILAIVGANPEAFAENNLNGLKANSRLIIPSTALVKTIPAEQAKMEVFAHDSAWQSKQPIEHVLFPPYVNEETTEPAEDQVFNAPLISEIPPVPRLTSSQARFNPPNNFSSYLPKAENILSRDGETIGMDQQLLQQAKLKAEMDLAIAAIGSVREANNILKDQLTLAQAENKRLLDELKKRDERIVQLQKEMRSIKTRQGLAGQAIQDSYKTDANFWPWLLMLLIVTAAGGAGYWWYWIKPQKEGVGEREVEPPKADTKFETISDPDHAEHYPTLTPLENPVMAAQPVYIAPIVEETNAMKDEAPSPEKPEEPGSNPSESNLIEFIEESPLPSEEDVVKITPPAHEENEDLLNLENEAEEERGLELQQMEDEPSLDFKPESVSTETSTQLPPPVKSQKALDTLLDLAKTYMSMGDKDAAHQSLEEVLAHGNDQQKNEAEGLLNKLENLGN